jgi:uncharacterized protein
MERGIRKRQRKRYKNPSIEVDYSLIRILTGSDLAKRKLPFTKIKSTNPGPTIGFTACVHGDEVGGIVVLQELFKRLRTRLLKGTVFAFPLMNPIGFETSSRRITLSDEDLNRSFPGNKEGSVGERIASTIFTKIKQADPSLVIDLHNDWRKSIPYTIIDPISEKKKELYERIKSFAQDTGFPIILDTDDVEKTLTYSLLKEDIPAFTIELGESDVVNETDVEQGLSAIWTVLENLKMVGPLQEDMIRFKTPEGALKRVLKYSSVNSHTSGIIRFLIKPGDIVKKGQPIAKAYNAFGKLLEVLKAAEDGIVLGYSDSSVAFPGTQIMAFGDL